MFRALVSPGGTVMQSVETRLTGLKPLSNVRTKSPARNSSTSFHPAFVATLVPCTSQPPRAHSDNAALWLGAPLVFGPFRKTPITLSTFNKNPPLLALLHTTTKIHAYHRIVNGRLIFDNYGPIWPFHGSLIAEPMINKTNNPKDSRTSVKALELNLETMHHKVGSIAYPSILAISPAAQALGCLRAIARSSAQCQEVPPFLDKNIRAAKCTTSLLATPAKRPGRGDQPDPAICMTPITCPSATQANSGPKDHDRILEHSDIRGFTQSDRL